MTNIATANKLELLRVTESVANEKGIGIDIVKQALEAAYEKAASSKYGTESDIKAELDPESGDISLVRRFQVVEQVENRATELTLEAARQREPAAEIGGEVAEALPPVDFGRVAAQSAKQVIIQMVREAEREQQYQEYKDRVGDVVPGTVNRTKYNNVYLDIGRGEAVMRKQDRILDEPFRDGDRVRGYIYEVTREQYGPQIKMSRTHTGFMAHLFAAEVPEIYDGTVEIQGIARDPGSRAKIAVSSNDASIDPVGACVGHRGSRVQVVVNELQGEKIDIVPWSADPTTYVTNALAPAEILSVQQGDSENSAVVIVTNETLSRAIGRRGQNVRLACQLTGWDIRVMSEEEAGELQKQQFEECSRLFATALNVDEMVGQMLAADGFAAVEEIVTDTARVAAIEGIGEAAAENLKERAQEYLDEVDKANREECAKLGVADDLRQVAGMTTEMMVVLGRDGIRSLKDFAECATDDLAGWRERVDGKWTQMPGTLSEMNIGRDEAERMIMQARVLAGLVDESVLETEADEDDPEIENAEAAAEAEPEAAESDAGEPEKAESDAVETEPADAETADTEPAEDSA